MEPVEYCEMKHGYCACAKTGTVYCEQILREHGDELKVQAARNERDAADRKRRSRYIEDEPRGGLMLREHQAALIAALSRMSSEMVMPVIPRRMGKTASQVAIEKYSRDDALFSVDFSEVEARMMKHIEMPPLTTARERRLGSSDKPFVKFHDDPMKVRKK